VGIARNLAVQISHLQAQVRPYWSQQQGRTVCTQIPMGYLSWLIFHASIMV
jgi:hypothetical protein